MFRSTLMAVPLVCVAMTATAHSKSGGTTPADGATVEEVTELSMRFDDPMRIISVTLSSSGGEVEIDRETGTEPATLFRAMPATPLAPGTYRLDWRGMAADGHPMQGGFSFTVAE